MSAVTRTLDLSPGRPLPWFLRPSVTPRLLIFDLDGTLAPLAETPGRACVPARVQRALAVLAACPRTVVAVLSGRSLADAARKVGVSGLVYLGNHGLTSTRPGLGAPRRELGLWTDLAAEARRRLAPVAKRYPGCLLELKGPDLSLHYRRVAPRQVPDLLRETLASLRGLRFRARPGKLVMEFRPPRGGNKGTALRRLAGRLAPGWKRKGLCLYVGDDRTDEDAFRAARRLGPRMATFKVGAGATRAKYRLPRQPEVETLLGLLACPLGQKTTR
jgi:trehalose 6-phosphate phosphatase